MWLQGRPPLLSCTIALALALASRAGAATPDHPYRPNLYEQSGTFTQTAGRLWVPVTNLGVLGNPWYPFYGDESGGEWPAGSGIEHLNYAALWVGALDANGEAHVSTAYSDQKEQEFRPGLDATQTIYRAYEGIPGGVRIGSAFDPDDDGDGLVDEESQNGVDDDGDGLIDEDFGAASDQMLSCEYTDMAQSAIDQNPEHVPLMLSVHQRTFAWSTPGLDDMVGFEFTITHSGTDTLRDVYLGLVMDGDVGPRGAAQFWADDYAGRTRSVIALDAFNTTGVKPDCLQRSISVDVGWVRDHLDPGPDQPADQGTLRRTPLTPGYIGCAIFTRTVDPITGLASRVAYTALRREQEATTDRDKYDVLRGRLTGVVTDTTAGDYRVVLGVGPFPQIAPGQTISLAGAVVCAASMPELLQNAATAALAYEGRWIDADHSSLSGTGGREACFTPGPLTLVDDDCNPDTRRIAIGGSSCHPENYINLDCDACTPSIEGAEFALHWAAPVNPPLPTLFVGGPGSSAVTPSSTDPSVSLAWDNLPEVIPDPAAGVPLVDGYRIWKAANWTRPPGSRGPSADLWMLVADISLKGDDPQALPVSAVTDTTVRAKGLLYGSTYYPAGRYRYVDTHVLPGVPYFYAVTPYRVDVGPYTTTKVSRAPFATYDNLITLQPAARDDLSGVRIVPNPYVGHAGWDLTPSASDPTGTKIGFFGLPRGRSTIQIYTISGDRVASIDHDGSGGDGGAYWDLRTRSGQDAASGMYFVYIQSPGLPLWKGHLIIVR